jgi:hypothetical protein
MTGTQAASLAEFHGGSSVSKLQRAASALVGLCLLTAPSSVECATITFDFSSSSDTVLEFSGTFAQDNDVALVLFDLPTGGLFTARTTSHAPGGLDPILSLFDAAGALLFENDDADFNVFDSLITLLLTPGSYALALTQAPNFFNPVSGEFEQAGTPFFTADFFGSSECSAFVDFNAMCRTGQFAGTITLPVAVSPVPEPGTLTLFAAAALGAAASRRVGRRRAG